MAARDRKRRILFNWDGSDVLGFLEDATPEKFIEYVFDCIDGSQVDTLLYCFGSGNVAEYESDVLEWPGEADGFEFADEGSRRRSENARKLARLGANPPEAISKACRERGLEVFVSLRMNDTHDAFILSERPSFKREHPEWLLPQLRDNFAHFHYDGELPGLLEWKERPDFETRRATSLNYAVKEVRELKLAVIREYFEKWDFDGIELDWTRHNCHFMPGTEFDNRHILTEFTREVRKITEAAAKRRSHPVAVFARVPETLQGCTEGGYDVAQWFTEDLIDGLVLGDMVVNVPYLKQFRDLMGARKVPLYPSVYGYGQGYNLWDDATIRAVAASFWAAGADGIATYNLYPKGEFRRDVLRQIGDPRTMDGLDKRYISPRNQLLCYTRFSRHNCPASALPAYLNIKGLYVDEPFVPHALWAKLEVADDIPALAAQGKVERVELVVGLEDLHPEDRIFIGLNGYSLTKEWADHAAPHIEKIVWDLDAEDVDGSQPGNDYTDHIEFPGVRFDVSPEWLRRGTNVVQVLLLPSDHRPMFAPHDVPPIFVTRVELFTGFKKE